MQAGVGRQGQASRLLQGQPSSAGSYGWGCMGPQCLCFWVHSWGWSSLLLSPGHSNAPPHAASRWPLVCAGHSLKCCWGWASAGDAGPPPCSIPWVLGSGVDFAPGKFCTGQAPPVLEGSSVGTSGHHLPTLPQWATAWGLVLLMTKPHSECAMGRFEHGRAANFWISASVLTEKRPLDAIN